MITNAAAKVDNVVGLVYVTAFAPDEGETLLEIEGNSKDSVLTSALLAQQYPTGQGTETEFLIDPAKFVDAFASDVPEKEAAVMAATQRPVSLLGFPNRRGRRCGRTFPPGRWWLPVTRPPAARSCDPWPSGPGLLALRSKAPT